MMMKGGQGRAAALRAVAAAVLTAVLLLSPASLSMVAEARTINFETDVGAIADDNTLETCIHNTQLLNKTLQTTMRPHDTLFVPNVTFWLMGGVYAENLHHNTFLIDGTFSYTNNQTAWPRQAGGHVYDCMALHNSHNITFTSSGTGTLEGNGKPWWGAVKYLEIGENRPKLLTISNTSLILIEHILFHNSPYYNLDARDVRDVEIRHTDVLASYEENPQRHNLQEIQAFNTDGFDVAGKNVYIHDCNIWNDDDCIAVKQQDGSNFQSQCSENYLIERVNASGVGFTIGSIGATDSHACVRNITFRDSVMHNTFKGLYMKSRPSGTSASTGEITDVLYENITIIEPTQWAVWIGPQQAGYKGACSLLWPEDPLAKCPVPENMSWSNVKLKDIRIIDPMYSPGVILGNESNPMQGITFDNVTVTNADKFPWFKKYYYCEGVKDGHATGGTDPKPPCFSSN